MEDRREETRQRPSGWEVQFDGTSEQPGTYQLYFRDRHGTAVNVASFVFPDEQREQLIAVLAADAALIARAPTLEAENRELREALEGLMDETLTEHYMNGTDGDCSAALGCRRCEVEDNARKALERGK